MNYLVAFKPIAFLSIASIAAALAACAPQPRNQVLPLTRVSPYDKQADFELRFGRWGEAGRTTASAEDLQNALYEFGVRNPDGAGNANIRNLLARLDADSNRTNGIGGAQARAYIEAVQPALSGNGWGGSLDPFDPNHPNRLIEVVGQIQREVVNKDGVTEPGFYFNAANNSGHLWVLMETSSKRGASVKRFAQMFKVVVAPGGFTVEPKTLTSAPDYNPSNVFPIFASAAGIAVDAQKAGGYDWKLWASGTTISVAEYWYDNHPYDDANPNWRKYYPGSTPPPGQRLKNIFETDPMACVDMLFESNPMTFINGRLPDPGAPPFYCLGRCKNPPIINTR